MTVKTYPVKLTEDLRCFRRDRESNTLAQMSERVPTGTLVELGPRMKVNYNGRPVEAVPFLYQGEIYYFLLPEIHIRHVGSILDRVAHSDIDFII